MKLALVADLHGNLPATEAIAREIAQVGADEIWFLGDAVGKGPDSARTCDWVRSHCTVCIGGNWDYGIGAKEYPADEYYWDQLGEERMAWLRSLPEEAELVNIIPVEPLETIEAAGMKVTVLPSNHLAGKGEQTLHYVFEITNHFHHPFRAVHRVRLDHRRIVGTYLDDFVRLRRAALFHVDALLQTRTGRTRTKGRRK